MSSMQSAINRLVRLMESRREATTSTRSFHQGTVTSVDAIGGTAEVLIGNASFGTTATIQKQSGFLPAVGDSVMMQMNGAEPIVIAPRTMVEGDMQSRSFVTDVSGWQITADGDAEFNDVYVRGFVNGIRIGSPPMLWARRAGSFSVPNDTWTRITGLTNMTSGLIPTPGRPTPSDAYGSSMASSRITLGLPGVWRQTLFANWGGINSVGSRQLKIVETTQPEERIVAAKSAEGIDNHNVCIPWSVGEPTYKYELWAYQSSGGTRTISPIDWMWEFISD